MQEENCPKSTCLRLLSVGVCVPSKTVYEDLVAGCNSFMFVFHSFISFHIHTIHLSVAIHGSLSPSHRLKAQWEDPPCVAEPRIELGPALQQADAPPTATPHHTEPRRTIDIYTLGPLKMNES
jgi:hypothetical protein